MEIPWDALIEQATVARTRAHAPYSAFRVGAALLDGEGRIFAACNVENASYGLSVCAERNAVGAAISAGSKEFCALVVVTDVTPPVAPCGACRQVLAEFGDFPVRLVGPSGGARETSVAALLPMAFGAHDLG